MKIRSAFAVAVSDLMLLVWLVCMAVALIAGGLLSSMVDGYLLADRLPLARMVVPVTTSIMSGVGTLVLMVAIKRIRRARTRLVEIEGGLCAALDAVEFDVPIGGPVRVQRIEGKMFQVQRGGGQAGVLDAEGFPHDTTSLLGTLKPWAASLEFARRVSIHLSTPPTSAELSAWLVEFLARQDGEEIGPDGRSLCGFITRLALVVDNDGRGARDAAATYHKMEDHLREAVPPRFLLPLMDAFTALYREKPTPELKP